MWPFGDDNKKVQKPPVQDLDNPQAPLLGQASPGTSNDPAHVGWPPYYDSLDDHSSQMAQGSLVDHPYHPNVWDSASADGGSIPTKSAQPKAAPPKAAPHPAPQPTYDPIPDDLKVCSH